MYDYTAYILKKKAFSEIVLAKTWKYSPSKKGKEAMETQELENMGMTW